MEKPAGGGSYYLKTGLKAKKSERRKDSDAGRLAGWIIDRIPKDFDVYKDSDLNEVHLAEEIIKACGRHIRYCPQIGWMAYNAGEGRWTERGALPAVEEVIKHFGHLLYEGAKKTRPDEDAFANRILSAAGINAIKTILKNDAVIAADQEQFDGDPDLLNCMGDRYNLRTGECRPSAPEDMFSKTTLCKAAKLKRHDDGHGWEAPEIPKKFNAFMKKATSKDGAIRNDLALFIMCYFGYSLTGDNGASFFVNFHGEGANGKSVLLDLMLELFGGYAAPIPKDLVIENQFSGQFDLASLVGIRLAVLADAPAGYLNMDQLKPIVSGQKMNGKRKYLKDFEFEPICKLAVGSNPKLKLRETGRAARRRIRLVPFDYTIPEEEQVAFYHRRLLKEEAPQILAWLIYFAGKYYERGEGPKAFPFCAAVDEASQKYIDDEDLVGRWKEERTEAAEGAETSADELYKDFRKWAEDEGIKKVMQKATFGDCLTLIIPDKKRKKDGVYYLGVRLKAKPLPGDPGG